ncbi:GH21840 [Drosophila grimshawi]|uniref:GH21840 n=2 Tax=Drosophila grimshawi TaxID=7222 RepID=B4J7L1_DROGR|nr:GH21840 [Drosophila grimshawi]
MAQKVMRFGKSHVSYLSLAVLLGYHLVFCLCTFAFLSYLLCYDVIEYVNEERRYLVKMKSAGVLAKCFYYIMRLLKLPIF